MHPTDRRDELARIIWGLNAKSYLVLNPLFSF